ncbi:MAG: hypothetical protein ABI877_21980, partial [Gemmatimonadaceae bacterium]
QDTMYEGRCVSTGIDRRKSFAKARSSSKESKVAGFRRARGSLASAVEALYQAYRSRREVLLSGCANITIALLWLGAFTVTPHHVPSDDR